MKEKITAIAVDLRGTIIASIRHRQQFVREDSYFRYLGEVVNRIIAEASLCPTQILGVGIGLPSLITGDNRTVYYGKILEITGLTCQELSRYIPYSTALFTMPMRLVSRNYGLTRDS